MDELKMYMDNLDEYINDEDKLVTYKWLSINLKVPCNIAKRLLHHFVSSQEKGERKDGLHVTYLVMGTVCTDDGFQQTKVCVVPESELAALQASLESVQCVHVYSVSKSKLPDQTAALYTADYDCTRQDLPAATQYGNIECPAALQRSDTDIASLRKLGTYRPSTPQDSRKAPDPRLQKPAAAAAPAAASNSDRDSRAAATADKKTKAAGKGALSSLFAAQQKNIKSEAKGNDVKEEKAEVKEEVDSKKPAAPVKKVAAEAKKVGRISGFFTKGVNPRDKEVKTEAEADDPDQVDIKDDSDGEETALPATIKKEKKSPVKKSPKKASPVNSKTKSRAKAKPVTQPRRSRILKVESDSSEGEESESEPEDNECPAPSPLPPATEVLESSEEDESPAPTTRGGDRGKKRKLVDRTYEDEDGFFVTKKEFVDVTDSESEDPAPPPPTKKQARSGSPSPTDESPGSDKSSKSPTKTKAAGKKTPVASKKPAKASSPTKNKQASIMSFFKKK